eukprot:11202228-Lingulodinium_polyedra.AAC.1
MMQHGNPRETTGPLPPCPLSSKTQLPNLCETAPSPPCPSPSRLGIPQPSRGCGTGCGAALTP